MSEKMMTLSRLLQWGRAPINKSGTPPTYIQTSMMRVLKALFGKIKLGNGCLLCSHIQDGGRGWRERLETAEIHIPFVVSHQVLQKGKERSKEK